MASAENFHSPNLDVDSLIQALSQWFRGQHFTVQVLDSDGGHVIQAKQDAFWRNALGASAALNVTLHYDREQLTVVIGSGKWIDKAVAAGIGGFLLAPLLVTAALGAWEQSQLPSRTLSFIRDYLLRTPGGTSAGTTVRREEAPETPTEAPTVFTGTAVEFILPHYDCYQFCADCGVPLRRVTRFCSACGSKTA